MDQIAMIITGPGLIPVYLEPRSRL